ncbi:MAG: hypothetical protein KR126chlam1_00932 [Chlamydiae bacterium]|nr:hypothetical protein [Chlamydiota bacterium]
MSVARTDALTFSKNKAYHSLPWPKEISKITVFTEVIGGLGDISAAAKVIKLLQRIEPSLTFNWIISSKTSYPEKFLKIEASSNIIITKVKPKDLQPVESDFLVVGPVICSKETEEITTSPVPRFAFLENAIGQSFKSDSPSHEPDKGLVMGLEEGTGVLFDKTRIEAPLSGRVSCLSYLKEIEDPSLKHDLYKLLDCDDLEEIPDEGKFSINGGYAHKISSWKKFITSVVIDEQEKDVVIVLNRNGYYGPRKLWDIQNEIVTDSFLSLLNTLGYCSITLLQEEERSIETFCSREETGRRVSVIMRPSFSPGDMRRLQLASERLLATGDNSAAEAWASRCKLYHYEIFSPITKEKFLQQQIAVAKDIYTPLGELLDLVGSNDELSSVQMKELFSLLQDPKLHEKTLAFCQYVTENYSFAENLEGGLKRAAWNGVMPGVEDEGPLALCSRVEAFIESQRVPGGS